MAKEVIAALIAGGVAILSGISSAVYAYLVTDKQSRKQERAIEELKGKQERDIEELKGTIADGNAERNARRDYIYEARKKLYEEYEPLFFRFSEATEAAIFRISSLANRAAEGKFEFDGWLQHDSYYLQSTLYYLMSPLANFKLIRGKLTFVDLRVDKSIYSTYILGRVLFVTFSDAFTIAKKMNGSYDPYRKKHPDPRQDVPIGITENIAELLITTDPETATRRKVMNLGQFQKMYEDTKNSDLKFFASMLKEFHPQRLPVLWSVLIVQAIIYKVVNSIRRRKDGVETKEMLFAEVKKAAEEINISELDWRNEDQKKEFPDEKLKELFLQASEHIKASIEEYY